MHEKRGQTTLYIIIGIIILITITFTLYTKQEFSTEKTKQEIIKTGKIPLNIKPAKDFIDSCLIKSGEKAIATIGLQGGYIDSPNKSLVYATDHGFTLDAPYYFYINKTLIPSIKKIEDELSKYVHRSIRTCFDNFTVLKEKGYSITENEIELKSSITPDEVVFIANYPVKITFQDSVNTLSDFLVKVPSRLFILYNTAENITVDYSLNPGSICLSCINELAIENRVFIDMINNTQNEFVFFIEDKASEEDYNFVFAHKYK